eukprot:403363543
MDLFDINKEQRDIKTNNQQQKLEFRIEKEQGADQEDFNIDHLHIVEKVNLNYNIKQGQVNVSPADDLGAFDMYKEPADLLNGETNQQASQSKPICKDSDKTKIVSNNWAYDGLEGGGEQQKCEDLQVQKEWITYRDLYFEHSDTCPSRRNRIHHAKINEPKKLSERFIKMAVCAYIMDKDNNLLITRRPSWLSIFPQAWVLPGGIVDKGETFEQACLREIQEEVGLRIEPNFDLDRNCCDDYYREEASQFVMTYPPIEKHRDDSHETAQKVNICTNIPVDFEPYYLYESVTKNIQEIDDHQNEQFPPISQHLVLFYMAKIQESYKNIPLELNLSEVEETAWINLEQLRDTFDKNYHDLDGYRFKNKENQNQTKGYSEMPRDQIRQSFKYGGEYSTKINSDSLFPLYRYNPKMQGLGKGHYLALKYLLRANKLID